MKVDFENVGPVGYDIWAATVGDFRINVSKNHHNLNPFVFEMILADDEYTDIAAKGFGPDLETTMKRGVKRAFELTADRQAALADVPVELVDEQGDFGAELVEVIMTDENDVVPVSAAKLALMNANERDEKI